MKVMFFLIPNRDISQDIETKGKALKFSSENEIVNMKRLLVGKNPLVRSKARSGSALMWS